MTKYIIDFIKDCRKPFMFALCVIVYGIVALAVFLSVLFLTLLLPIPISVVVASIWVLIFLSSFIAVAITAFERSRIFDL